VKVAVLSHVLPPMWSGQAMVIERLLRAVDPAAYILVRTGALQDDGEYSNALPARTFHLPEAFLAIATPSFRRKLRSARSLLRTLRSRSDRLAEILRSEKCDALVVCTGGDMLDIPAGCIAARRARVRFFPYYFDHWSQQTFHLGRRRRLAERVEPFVLRRATTVIVPNESLAHELESRYRVRTAIVRNACEIPAEEEIPSPGRSPGAAASIVYTGAVYAANYDAFRNLIEALESIAVDVTVDVYTAQSPKTLAAAGIYGPVRIHEHRPAADVPSLHAGADILFLPLAFRTPYPSLIRSSNPGKMGEYLASGRPILVHAPPDTFVAEYFRKHECGVLVDELDPTLVASAVWKLLEDDDLRRRVSEAARERAYADYDLKDARAAFAATVGLPGANIPIAADAEP
jgi:glycosyltransferase involved in cell wall biosynthesis